MALHKLRTLTLKLEDPEHPLLGPIIKSLYLFGLWQKGSLIRKTAFNIAHHCFIILTCIQFIDIYTVRHDMSKISNNISITFTTLVTMVKCFSFVLQQKKWENVILEISKQELSVLKERDPIVTEQMNSYKKYIRIIMYMYWLVVFSTNICFLSSPLLKYASSKTYREKISDGEEPLPQIILSWFPFDNTKMPGYMWGLCFHVIMVELGGGYIAAYDTNAVAIMCYLKGQMVILKGRCRDIFKGTASKKAVMEKIKECHRHHSVLVKHYEMVNDLISPIMFLHVLVCSGTISCCVILVTMADVNKSQKVWIVQYLIGLVLQLFLFCWHGNQVAVESEADSGVYESDWWKGDKYLRKMVLLLAIKLNNPLILKAGPFTTLSLPTFINIMKGSYSFYTLFSQIQTYK